MRKMPGAAGGGSSSPSPSRWTNPCSPSGVLTQPQQPPVNPMMRKMPQLPQSDSLNLAPSLLPNLLMKSQSSQPTNLSPLTPPTSPQGQPVPAVTGSFPKNSQL